MAKFASRGAAPHPARAPALDPESAPSHLKTLSAVCLDTLAVHGARRGYLRYAQADEVPAETDVNLRSR